jgi:AraC-like DNA-binding protein
VAENNLFDMAKLIDIAAIFGLSNETLVRDLIEAVFESEPAFLENLQETFEMMISVLRRIFRDALRTD